MSINSNNRPSMIETNPNDNVSTTNPVLSKQPQKKPSAAAIDKKERKQLWQSLAKYCDELIAEARTNGYVPTHRFVHPQNMIDNFIKLGLRPPNNPRGLEKFYDNFITRCNYLSDNNKNTKNKTKNPPKKWMPKGNRHGKYAKKRGHKHLKVPHTTRQQSHNKIGSFPISSQSIQHHFHQYHINKNNEIQHYDANKKQLRSELPAPHIPRNPKIYSNSLTLLQRKKYIINAEQQIQIPIQNEQMTPDQLMAQYHAQMQMQQHQQQQQRQRVVYNAQHDHYYHVNVGTPQQQQQNINMKRKKRDSQSLPNKQMNHAAKQYMYKQNQTDIKDDSSNSNESNHILYDQPYLPLRSTVSGSSQGTGNDVERPALSDKLTGNTDASHFSHSYNSDSDKEQNIQSMRNIALRIDTARTADIIPIGLPHNVSRYQEQQQPIYYQSLMGSRTPVPTPQSANYQNPTPTHTRSQSMDINYKKQSQINAVLQQQYLEFNQLSPINPNQAVRTFSRQQHIPHNRNKYSENLSPISAITPHNMGHSFGLQTVPELKEEIPNNFNNQQQQQYIAQCYSPVSPMYNVNGVTVGMVSHHQSQPSQDSTSSLSNFSSLITPKITPSGHTSHSFFSPTSQKQYEIDDRSFDNYTQSLGYQTPASPYYQMQTLYEDDNSIYIPSDEMEVHTATPFHAKKDSLNIAQNNIYRRNLLDAQFVIDSNASGVSQWSAISTLSAVSAKSDDAITVGAINTDGKQVRLLFEYLQNDVKDIAILLDLNAVRSRSSSMASIKDMRLCKKQSVDDLQGVVFTTYNPNPTSDNTLTPFEITPNSCNTITPNDDDINTFSDQMASFATHGVSIIDEKAVCKPAVLSNPSSNNTERELTSSSKSNSKRSSSNSPASSLRQIKNRSHGLAPHNDLDGLVIFEPVKTFEILDMYRSQTKNQVFLSLRALFEKTLQSAFVGCVKYLRHRLKHTVIQIKYVFFVSFAMPNPNGNVSQIWYELCKLRMEHIANTVRECELLCEQSKMKPQFISCITPIDPNSFSDKTPSANEGDIYKNNDDFLANYHFPEYAKYESYLPFKNRIELSQSIRKTLKP